MEVHLYHFNVTKHLVMVELVLMQQNHNNKYNEYKQTNLKAKSD